jgi:hypothetical protein
LTMVLLLLLLLVVEADDKMCGADVVVQHHVCLESPSKHVWSTAHPANVAVAYLQATPAPWLGRMCSSGPITAGAAWMRGSMGTGLQSSCGTVMLTISTKGMQPSLRLLRPLCAVRPVLTLGCQLAGSAQLTMHGYNDDRCFKVLWLTALELWKLMM